MVETTVERAGQLVTVAAQLVMVTSLVTWIVDAEAAADGATDDTATAVVAWICPSPIWEMGAVAMTAVAMKAAAATVNCILEDFKGR